MKTLSGYCFSFTLILKKSSNFYFGHPQRDEICGRNSLRDEIFQKLYHQEYALFRFSSPHWHIHTSNGVACF